MNLKDITLNNLFKSAYGKDWNQASFLEKAEAVFFGFIFFYWISGLFNPKK